MREDGVEGQGRMKMERLGEREDSSGREHVHAHMDPPLPRCLHLTQGVPVTESLAGPGVPPRGLCNRCNIFQSHGRNLRLFMFVSNRKLKSPQL